MSVSAVCWDEEERAETVETRAGNVLFRLPCRFAAPRRLKGECGIHCRVAERLTKAIDAARRARSLFFTSTRFLRLAETIVARELSIDEAKARTSVFLCHVVQSSVFLSTWTRSSCRHGAFALTWCVWDSDPWSLHLVLQVRVATQHVSPRE